MHPVLLGLASHDDEISGTGFERDRPAASPWLNKEMASGTQSKHWHNALGPAARVPVAVPSGAIASVTIEIQPNTIALDSIVARQNVRRFDKRSFRHEPHLWDACRQSRLAKNLIKETPVVLSKGHRLG